MSSDMSATLDSFAAGGAVVTDKAVVSQRVSNLLMRDQPGLLATTPGSTLLQQYSSGSTESLNALLVALDLRRSEITRVLPILERKYGVPESLRLKGMDIQGSVTGDIRTLTVTVTLKSGEVSSEIILS